MGGEGVREQVCIRPKELPLSLPKPVHCSAQQWALLYTLKCTESLPGAKQMTHFSFHSHGTPKRSALLFPFPRRGGRAKAICPAHTANKMDWVAHW